MVDTDLVLLDDVLDISELVAQVVILGLDTGHILVQGVESLVEELRDSSGGLVEVLLDGIEDTIPAILLSTGWGEAHQVAVTGREV